MCLWVVIILADGCKKTEPVPDYPQLVGNWEGTTSQGIGINISITTIKGILYVSGYDFSVYTSTGFQSYQWTNMYGIVSLNGLQFSISLGSGSAGPAFLNGTFNLTNITLDGNFAVYPPGNTTDLTTGYYSCNHVK